MNPRRSSCFDRVVELFDGEVRLLQRDVPETDEPIAMRGHEPGDLLVLHLHDARGEIGRREVQELARMDADDVDVDSLPIHFPEPAIHRRGVERHRAGAQVRHGAVDLRQVFHQRPGLVHEHVGVHIDRPDALSAHDDLAAGRRGGLGQQRVRGRQPAGAEQEAAARGGGPEKGAPAELHAANPITGNASSSRTSRAAARKYDVRVGFVRRERRAPRPGRRGTGPRGEADRCFEIHVAVRVLPQQRAPELLAAGRTPRVHAATRVEIERARQPERLHAVRLLKGQPEGPDGRGVLRLHFDRRRAARRCSTGRTPGRAPILAAALALPQRRRCHALDNAERAAGGDDPRQPEARRA